MLYVIDIIYYKPCKTKYDEISICFCNALRWLSNLEMIKECNYVKSVEIFCFITSTIPARKYRKIIIKGVYLYKTRSVVLIFFLYAVCTLFMHFSLLINHFWFLYSCMYNYFKLEIRLQSGSYFFYILLFLWSKIWRINFYVVFDYFHR